MSFILDALKKSENARQRQIGPAMAELPRRRRQTERPVWVWIVVGLLLVNIAVLALVLVRKQGNEAQPVTSASATLPGTAMQQPSAIYPPTVLPARQPIQVEPTPAPIQPAARNEGGAMVSSLAGESSLRNDLDGDGGLAAADPEMAQAVARAQAQLALERQQSAERPIQAPAVAPLASASPPSRAPTAANNPPAGSAEEVLPTVNELAASGRAFPPMRLDIHSFADKPAERFVLVNMRRYYEGQTLQEGPAIERITVDGVVLNQQGLRFLLPLP